MKSVVVVVAVALLVSAKLSLWQATDVVAVTVTSSFVPEGVANLFNQFKKDYNKKYASAAEEEHRFAMFVANMHQANEMNRLNPYASFGVNTYSDLSPEEFQPYHGGSSKTRGFKKSSLFSIASTSDDDEKERGEDNNKKRKATTASSAPACTNIDWREYGAVTPVRAQGQCGTCWAFGTIAGIEGQWYLAGHPLTSLSEQLLASCDINDDGCGGGFADRAFEWLLNYRQGRLLTLDALPYDESTSKGNTSACPADLDSLEVGAVITGFRDIEQNEDAMAAFVCAHGPLSISLAAARWHQYQGGIMTDCNSTDVDHEVLIVGFDDIHGPVPYWIIKNSWGGDYGEDGYLRLQKGTNQCDIKNHPTTSITPHMPLPADMRKPAAPPAGALVQRHCRDSDCTEGCTGAATPLGQCVPLGGSGSISGVGGSTVISCSAATTSVTMITYPFSPNCVGISQEVVMPLNQCVHDASGGGEGFMAMSCNTTAAV